MTPPDPWDAAPLEFHGIRARLVSEIRRADEETAVRADALLARMHKGPPGEREGGPAVTPSRPRS